MEMHQLHHFVAVVSLDSYLLTHCSLAYTKKAIFAPTATVELSWRLRA